MSDILCIEDLTVSFDKKKVVDGISFELKQGSITSIVGQSGSGKTISTLAILRLLPQNAQISGKILFQNQDLLQKSEKDLCKIRGNLISFVFQDPMTSLNPLHTIKKQIAEIIEIHAKKTPKNLVEERVIELLDLVGLKNFKDRLNSYPHQLSGGQRQRIMIAMAIANNVKILIADEPTTALDSKNQNEILKLLLNLKEKLNLTVLLITHNLKIVEKISQIVLVMKDGKIIERNEVKEIFKNPKEDYTKLLISSLSGKLQNNIQNTPVILEIKNLCVKYFLKKNFLGIGKKVLYANDNINFTLNKAKTLGIIGESGSGKSTMALAIANLIECEGEIIFDNKNIKNLTSKERNNLRQHIQIIFQDPYSSLNPRMKIKDIVSEGLRIHGFKGDIESEVNKILKEVEIDLDSKEKYPHQFSGGQRQRIAIARSLILKPKLLILDEPTSALDIITQNEILKLLQKLQKSYQISYILISHDMSIIEAMCDEIKTIQSGKIS